MAKPLAMLALFLPIISLTLIPSAQSQGPATAPSPYSSTLPMAPESAAAPLPGLDCTNALINMSSCLTYVEDGSNLTVPEKGCCPGLSSMVDNQPVCLCQLLSTGEAFGVKIDTTKALMLPTACKVQSPPVSLCSVLGIPVASPMSSSPSSEVPSGSGPSMILGTPTAATPPTTNGASTSTTPISTMAVFTLSIAIALF